MEKKKENHNKTSSKQIKTNKKPKLQVFFDNFSYQDINENINQPFRKISQENIYLTGAEVCILLLILLSFCQ